MDILRKAFAPTEFKLSETGEVSIGFSRFGVVDSDGDVTFPGAHPVGKSVPMSAYGHTSWDGALPIGKGVIRETSDMAVLDGAFFMDTDQGRNAYNTVKAMADLQEWSYGYTVLEGPRGVFDGKAVRELRKLDDHEVSPVLKGAGVGTATLAIKSAAPASDAPYVEQLLWYSEGLPALMDRFKSHAAARAKDGRKLSRADRAALEDLVETLDGQLGEARGLLTVPPSVDPAAQAAFAAAEMENLLAIARANGVPV